MAGLRARDVRDRLKDKCDPQVLYCIEALAEQQSAIRHEMVVMAKTISQMADIVSNFTRVAENMKNTVETMKNINRDHDELD